MGIKIWKAFSIVIDILSHSIPRNIKIHDFIALPLTGCDLGESLSLSLPQFPPL